MFMKVHLYCDMSVKFDKFLKNNLENIEILSSAGIFSNDVNLATLRATTEQFLVQVHTFKDNINK